MQVKFYNTFEKVPNSTKIPGSDFNPFLIPVYDGEIKGDFTPFAPVIRFASIAQTTVPAYFYAYIAKFSRYYFVTWAWVDGAWEGSFKCDVLGSFRAQILASSQYVERSASNQNEYLIDGAYTPTVNTTTGIGTASQADIWGSNYEDGTYVVGIVANGMGNNIGAVVYYAMSQTAFSVMMMVLLNSPNWLNISTSELSEDLQKALINPAQYIVSCVWLPISSDTFVADTDLTTTVRFGWWTFNLQMNVRVLHNPTSALDSFSRWWSISYNRHPQSSTYGTWVNMAPYAKYTLEFPPFGCIDLDTTDLLNSANKLCCHVFVHAYNGDAICYMFAGDAINNPSSAKYIGSMRGNIGVQIPVGQIRMDLTSYHNAAALGAAVGAEELTNILTGE